MSLLPWQQEAWQHVVKQAKSNSLPHAFLFSGLEGIGKQNFAETLANYLLCENINTHNAIDEACGECKQCKLFAAETHPDFKHIVPDEGSSVLKIDTIRDLMHFFQKSSMQGGRKISILSPAESLNHNAANALLKTLEEPTPGSVIILVSHCSGQLLPTIRSRCQVVDFKTPSFDQAHQWLSNEIERTSSKQYSSESLGSLLSLASNAPLKAAMYADIDALEENLSMLDEMGRILKNEVLASDIASRWVDDLAVLRLAWTIQWIEKILKIKSLGDTVESSSSKMMVYLAGHCNDFQLFDLYKASLQQYRLFLGKNNPNKQLGFECLLHQWAGLMQK